MKVTHRMTRAGMMLAAVLVSTGAAHAQARPVTPARAVPAPAQQAASPEALFSLWDKDKDKAVSLDEFKSGWQQVQAANVLRKLQDNFASMDANKTGSLETAEYAKLELIKAAGPSAPQIATFDADKSQGLNFQEYVAMVQAMVGNQR